MKIVFNEAVDAKEEFSTAVDVPVGRFFTSKEDTWLRVWDGAIQFHSGGCYAFNLPQLGFVKSIVLLPENFSVTIGGK
jgi:hypothetical protein